MFVALLALVIAMSSASVAAVMINGNQIKKNTVSSAQIKDKTIKRKDMSPKARRQLKGQTGAAGATGATGAAGPAGANGVAGYEVVTNTEPVPANHWGWVRAACPAGKKAIGVLGYWASDFEAVQAFIEPDRTGGRAYTPGLSNEDTLKIQVVCATVS